ncbi:MAG: antitoxin Xre-like helix-turn-helix domain-containing protein, partial [Rhodanobacteraceae bacterium]
MTASVRLLSQRPAVLQESARASGPALRAFDRIADRWALKPAERLRLLGIPRSTYFKYFKAPDRARLSPDTLERISYVLGIYQALQILLPRREAADAWIRHSNGAAVFNGHAPLELMLGGKVANLYVVRR